MNKKDLLGLTPDLSALAATLPTQNVAARSEPAKRSSGREPVIQLNLRIRRGLRQQIHRMAVDAEMTICAFVLTALREKGLPVRDEDLIDRRR